MNKLTPLLACLTLIFTLNLQCVAFAGSGPDFSVFAGNANLLPRERQFISCFNHKDKNSEGMHALSYLQVRGLLVELEEKTDPSVWQELLARSQNLIRTFEADCALKHLPREAENLVVDQVADAVISAGYGDDMVRNAEQFMSRDYRLASSYGFTGLKGRVVRAVMAGYSPRQDGDNMGDLRYLYYLCHAFHTHSECSPEIVLDVIHRYRDY